MVCVFVFLFVLCVFCCFLLESCLTVVCFCVVLYGLCFVLLCVCAFSSHVLMRFVCGLLCDAVCGVCNCMCGSCV